MTDKEVEDYMKDILNGFTKDDEYWKRLSEERKRKWVEYFRYGDMFIPINGSSDPFPQPPI